MTPLTTVTDRRYLNATRCRSPSTIDSVTCHAVSGSHAPVFLRPFDSQTPRADEKFLEQQGLDLPLMFEPVGVKVHELSLPSLINRINGERRACDLLLHAETAGEALHERGLADAQVAVQRENRIRRQRRGQFGGERAGLLGRGP